MNRKSVMLIAALLGIFLLGVVWWQTRVEPPVPEPVPLAVKPPIAPAATPLPEVTLPAIAHPLELPEAVALPEIGSSDGLLAGQLAELLGDKPWARYFYPDGIIRRIVATVDNLPRQEAPVRMWPLRPLGGWLQTSKTDDALFIAPENAQRYNVYISLAVAVDSEKLVALYRHFYPLFQQAYKELGYPDAYFNDRLIVALDDLLATPEPTAPLRLVQKKVRYSFADPDLDQRSAGQKIMLRMGSAHMNQLKPKLQALRKALARAE